MLGVDTESSQCLDWKERQSWGEGTLICCKKKKCFVCLSFLFVCFFVCFLMLINKPSHQCSRVGGRVGRG